MVTHVGKLGPFAAVMLIWVGTALSQPGIAIGQTPVQFNRDIRPILSDRCFRCHGPDSQQRQADLRLDIEESALGTRDGQAAAIVAHDPDASELMRRITSLDDDQRMPPVEMGKPLSDQQIALIRRWIAEGAPWQPHWSLTPVLRPAIAQGSDQPLRGVSSAIDGFILRRLHRQGIDELSPPADRRTLLRRLHLDLTGLPPTAQQIASFEDDPNPLAYERRVDQLLAAPAFGERLAAYWLDVVRYADTNGIHGDNHREHWLYRDYVIAAFNQDVPFDRFTIEQLAGDLLPSPTRDQRIASGYNRLNMTTREGGAQAKEYMAKYAADRVRNVSTTWLGATLGCAECHDHKFDPYTMRDFYSLAAFFADVEEVAVGEQPSTRLPTESQARQLADLDQQIAEAQTQLTAPSEELAQAQRSWEAEALAALQSWHSPIIGDAVAASAAEFTREDQDGATILLVHGDNPDQDEYTIHLPQGVAGATMLRLDCLPDGSLPHQGPGRASNGNFVLSEAALSVGEQPLAFQHAVSPHSQDRWPIAAAIDGKPETGWAILPKTGMEHQATLVLAQPAPEGPATLTLRFRHGAQHALGRLRLSYSTTTATQLWIASQGNVEALRAVLALPCSQRTVEQAREVDQQFRDQSKHLAPLRQQIRQLQQERQRREQEAPRLLITTRTAPRPMRILPRGNWQDDAGEVVQPAPPAALGSAPANGDRASRLDLARWIVSDENPAASRVLANRIWMLCLGRGIVATPEDLGSQGAWPSHPDLLDWLASELVESGWDVKHLVRLIVTSATYQQSSAASPELQKLDPYNALFARQGRFRLDAETVRDNALAVSGLLVQQVGGPSAKPYQPPGYWSHLNFPVREYQADSGSQQYRRGLYTYWCRTFLHPSLLAFDAPSREESCVVRARSNTPLSALVLLNDPSYVESARALAQRSLEQTRAGSGRTRLHWLFNQVLQRAATAAEVAVLLPLAQQHQAHYREHPEQAAELLRIGQSPAPDDQLAELAAWISVSRVILNLHETITRY